MNVSPDQLARIMPRLTALLVQHEDRRLDAYRDQAGYWTIGVGHLVTRDPNAPKPKSITAEECDRLLAVDIARHAPIVERAVKVPLSDNQWCALVSLAFNIPAVFSDSTLLRKLNAGDYQGAADEFPKWNKVRVNGKLVPSAGLTSRRADERALFLTP